MDQQELSQWMQRKRETIREVMDNLRAKIALSPRGNLTGWLAELREVFGRFRENMSAHIRVEEQGDYLQPVVEARPTLAKQVELLLNEHRQLGIMMDDLNQALGALGPKDNLLLRHTCERINNLLDLAERHEDHEAHMVLYVFTLDIGGDD